MEAADYMYGITMEEPGASNIISLHLTEETAEDGTAVPVGADLPEPLWKKPE
jgi:hypothetical protein